MSYREDDKPLDKEERAIKMAWSYPYVGDTHRLLLHTINKIKQAGVYANNLPIVQSSGTGKSRAVHELSKLVFTIPFNIRPAAENVGYPYPFPDTRIANHVILAIEGSKLSVRQARLRYLQFFEALFSVAIDKLVEIKSQKSFTSHQDVVQFWSKLFDDRSWRKEFFELVIQRRCPLPLERDWIVTESRFEAAVQKANEKLSELLAVLDGIPSEVVDSKEDVRIVIYFDEAHELQKPNSCLVGGTRFDALCSAAALLQEQPFFMLFMSTRLNWSFDDPLNEKHASVRRPSTDEGDPQAPGPFTELPFDVFVRGDEAIKPGTLTLKDINTYEFLIKFGRPMFKTMVDVHPERNWSWTIRELATVKLAGQYYNRNSLSDEAILAFLSLRLSINFKYSGGMGIMKQAKLVASNMRIAFSIPAHRQYIESGYPSEPLLAEGAARLTHHHKENSWSRSIVEELAHFLSKEVIEQGERGELVARLILTLAYDAAVLAESSWRKGLPAPDFFTGVPLEAFIRALFGDERAEKILDSRPDNVDKGVPLREAFKGAWVRFSQFQRAADYSGASSGAAFAAFLRGMAFQFSSVKGIDILIPVLLRDEALGEWVMTGILIQHDVREKRRRGMTEVAIDEEDIEFFPEDEDADSKARPYITLHMNLGVRPSVRSTGEHSQAEQLKAGTTSNRAEQPSSLSSSVPLTTPHPRYSIIASGCSNSIYAVVNDKERREYATLLASFPDHPRQEESTLSAVRRLKPYWTFGPDCFDWIDVPGLSEDAFEEIEEGVVTGDQWVHVDSDGSEN